MKGECPICHNKGKLVKHHWWNNNGHKIGHIRAICTSCNTTLRNLNIKHDHVLPEWEIQVKYVRRILTCVSKAMRSRPETKRDLQAILSNSTSRVWDYLYRIPVGSTIVGLTGQKEEPAP